MFEENAYLFIEAAALVNGCIDSSGINTIQLHVLAKADLGLG